MKVIFESPAGVRFTCSRCGDCCRTWNVMLLPGERASLEALDWRERVPSLVGETVAVRAGLGGPERLARRADGSCAFLGAANQCLIHENFGAEAKPRTCRSYPFSFHPLGSRVGVDVAFSCRAVSEGAGADVASHEDAWRALLEEGRRELEDRGSHRLTATQPVRGDLAWDIEAYLLRFLDEDSLAFLDRLRAMGEFMRLATTGDPAGPAARMLRDAIAAGLPRRLSTEPPAGELDRSQSAVFFLWLFLHLNPAPANFDLLPPDVVAAEARGRVAAASRFRDREGRPWIDNRELTADFEAIRRVDAAGLAALAPTVFAPFLCAKIVGQRFLAAPEGELSMAVGVQRLVLTWPMALWTAKALAAGRGASAAQEADLRAAVRLIDRSLGQVSLADMPAKQQEAFAFVFSETNLLTCATLAFS